jgi:hypothetical protein
MDQQREVRFTSVMSSAPTLRSSVFNSNFHYFYRRSTVYIILIRNEVVFCFS